MVEGRKEESVLMKEEDCRRMEGRKTALQEGGIRWKEGRKEIKYKLL